MQSSGFHEVDTKTSNATIYKEVSFSYIGITALLEGDISITDTQRHAPNPQIMINMATMYVGKDVANLLINKRIAKTTVLHHVCVIFAYGYVLRSSRDENHSSTF